MKMLGFVLTMAYTVLSPSSEAVGLFMSALN
jgi:hypothetical protein